VRGAEEDVMVFCASADAQKKAQLEERGVRVEEVSGDSGGRPDLHAVLRKLGELEITSVMIEGGSTVNGSALGAGVVDKAFLYYAPKMLGDGVPFTTEFSGRALRLTQVRTHQFGEDVAIEGYVRDPYTPKIVD
jgi:diaminohydroxyphosphoribosylaminopyrimidine deaminase/5-amino-6-(5-phosphoribosylamino)uracil reductase